MSDLEQARLLIAIADQDLDLLRKVKDLKIADSIFGFHAQQAAGKILKAWIAIIDIEYPKTHDLSALLKILEEQGQDIKRFLPLISYNPFAVQLRYDAYNDAGEPLDRGAAIKEIAALKNHVEKLIEKD